MACTVNCMKVRGTFLYSYEQCGNNMIFCYFIDRQVTEGNLKLQLNYSDWCSLFHGYDGVIQKWGFSPGSLYKFCFVCIVCALSP